MPTKVEKDSITGTETTGHEWDGIKELNTPLPKWWVWVFYITIIWSVGYMLLYPAVPYITGYTKGLIGYSQRVLVEESIAEARARQADFYDSIEASTPAQILDNPELLAFSLRGGEAAFADNCVPCHALGGAGLPGGYPVLADDDWLWGGSVEDIHLTLLHGIRHDNDETRFSIMTAFGGEFGILSREEIRDVADYVLSLSGVEGNAEAVARGEEIFATQCVSCHGDDGRGLREFGAPNLADAIWLYGGSRSDVIAQITRPSHGVMPAFNERLDEATIKMLTVYVHSLGGGE